MARGLRERSNQDPPCQPSATWPLSTNVQLHQEEHPRYGSLILAGPSYLLCERCWTSHNLLPDPGHTRKQ